jgi:hypothetical protein
MTKTCSMCRETKPVADFTRKAYINLPGDNPDGRHYYCRSCKQKGDTAYNVGHREQRAAAERERHALHPEVNRARASANHARNPGRRYGLTSDEFWAMFDRQGGKCPICRASLTIGTQTHAVDHDHSCCPGIGSCGRCVRGLLCAPCNKGMGHFKDDPDRLIAAAEFLRQYAARKAVAA